MVFLGLLCVILVPYFAGIVVNRVLKERESDCVLTYVSGLLSLFVAFLGAILLTLRLNRDLRFLEKVFLIPTVGFAAFGILLLAIELKKNGLPKLAKPRTEVSSVAFFVSAIVLCLYSFIWLAPSYINDDTWEIVTTTITTGTIYQYSAMTGKEMIAGLPIFNKVYILPMLYSCLCDSFGISMRLLGGFTVPVFTFVINLYLVYRIGKKSEVKNLNWYMVLYELLLISGTYLPSNGIPVTAGYAILREGYSGYAVAYGIVLPMAVYLLLCRKYIKGLLALIPLAGLIRLDRIFFAVCTPVSSYIAINEVGKLMAFLLISLFVAVLFAVNKKTTRWCCILTPEVFISLQCEKLLNGVNDKKKRFVFSIGIALISLSTVSFMPFSDSVELRKELSFEKEVRNTLNEYKAYGKTIWASDEFMATARRIDGTVYTLYGRDDINTMMSGLDYEPDGGHSWDFYYSYLNMHVVNPLFYPSELTVDEAMLEAKAEGMDIYIE